MGGGFGRLEVVRLGGLDSSESGPSALDVDDQARNVRSRQIGDPLGHQADTGGGCGRHDPDAGGSGTEDHVDGRDFGLGLQIDTADLRHPLGHVCRHLGLRGDGVSEEVPASGGDCRLGDGLVSLHEYFLVHVHISIMIATSGHMVAQDPQPVHALWSVTWAGWYPLLFVMLLSSAMMCFGHAITHISHPLQMLLSTVTFGICTTSLPRRPHEDVDRVYVRDFI